MALVEYEKKGVCSRKTRGVTRKGEKARGAKYEKKSIFFPTLPPVGFKRKLDAMPL